MTRADVMIIGGSAAGIEEAITPKRLKGRKAMLAVLARAAPDKELLAQFRGNPSNALTGYYTLTREEIGALVGGDMEKIESWFGKLDQRHRTWLITNLAQEKR